MHLLKDASESVQRNWEVAAIFAVGSLAISWPQMGLARLLFPDAPENLPAWFPGFHFAAVLVNSSLYALLCSVCFARLGKEIDRPLWKCRDDLEAVRRFFTPWLMLFLLTSTLSDVAGRLMENGLEGPAVFFVLSHTLCFVLGLPMGACIMHAGGLHWDALHEVFKPMRTLFPLCLYAIGLMFLELFWQVLLGPLLKESLSVFPVILLPVAYLDCLTFALMWRICMIQRDLPPDSDWDDDF